MGTHLRDAMEGNGSPQLEDGYLKIANELWDALIQFPLSDYERRVLMAIMRKTYGFNKKQDAISLTQICKMTKILRQNVCKAIKRLVSKQIILRTETTYTTNYLINKYYLTWQSPYRDYSLEIPPSLHRDNGVVSVEIHTKDILTKDIKDNINTCSSDDERASSIPKISDKKRKTQLTKEDEELFRRWYEVYPRKQGKADAMKAWLGLKPDLPLAEKMIVAAEKQKASGCLAGDLQYIPLPASWLRGRRWEDEGEKSFVERCLEISSAN